MAQSRFSLSDATADLPRVSDAAAGRQCDNKALPAGKGGKVRLSRMAFLRRKPYDRPSPSDVVDRRLPFGKQVSSLPVRLVDSASNLLASSASYLFESFFKRRQVLWISNGSRSADAAERGSTAATHVDKSKLPSENESLSIKPFPQGLNKGNANVEDVGFSEVEDFLKRQLLSREDVKRLTEVLKERADGDSLVVSRSDGNRLQSAVIQASKESNPVQVAKDFMGRRMTPQLLTTPARLKEGVGPPSRKDIYNGVREGSSLESSRRRVVPGASAVSLKRRLIADEDDVVLTVPSRRVRQKMTVLANASPYIRQVTSAAGRFQTPSLELKKLSDKAEKSLGRLEGALLPFKGKTVEGYGPNGDEDVPESSKARDNIPDTKDLSSAMVTPSKSAEPICQQSEPVTIAVSSPLEEAGAEETIEPVPEVPGMNAKGFHINAFVEDSSSDEEADVPIKTPLPTGAQGSGLVFPNEASLGETTMSRSSAHKQEPENLVKSSSAVMPDNSFHLSDASAARMSVLPAQQPMGGIGSPIIDFESAPNVSKTIQLIEPGHVSLAAEKSSFLLSSSKPPPPNSYLPFSADKKTEPMEMPAATTKTSLLVTSESLSSSPLPVPIFSSSNTSLESIISFSQSETGISSTISLPLETMTGKYLTKKEPARQQGKPVVAPDTNHLFSDGVHQPAQTSENVMPNTVFPETASKVSSVAEPTVAVSTPLFSVTPAPIPSLNQQGRSDTHSLNSSAVGSPLEVGGIRNSPMLESPSAENRQSDMDTMATDPMTEELEGTMGVAGPSGSLFGSTTNSTSTSAGETATFGSRPSISPFSFSLQSSTPSGVSQPPFSSQSSGAAGQMFSFGASGGPSISGNPFSGATQSSFLFGSSAAPSISSMFPATSSAPSSFPANPAPSFVFGVQASSSSEAISSSVFSGQMTPSANSFPAVTAQNNTSTLSFQATPTTHSASPFQFGVANASNPPSTAPTAPLFGGQTFAFGAQPSNTSVNPFAQNGGSNTNLFQFVGASAAAPQSTYSSGTAPGSSFLFGSQPASSPFSFTFGAQPTPSPTGQPFGFGGQPAAPAPAPAPAPGAFSLPGTAGQAPPGGASGMEFTGGFNLGATGGERAGRKFIKAKRIGGAKRGK